MDERIFDDVTRAIGGATSRRGALAGLAALAGLPLGAAARNGRGGRPERPEFAKKKKTCKPSKCAAGCCSGKKCLPGDAASACGTGGVACVACAAGQVCQAGACVEDLCNPGTCAGCCDGETCAPGNLADACGIGGVACVACGGGTPCCTAGGCAPRAWQPQTTFGSGPGNGAAQFHDPSGIALSGDQLTAWVADTLNGRVSIWTRPTPRSSAWSAQGTFGTPGMGIGQFGFPAMLAAAPDGQTIWVPDAWNSRVAVWTKTGPGGSWVNQTNFGTAGAGIGQLSGPIAVAVSPDGLTVWVADTGNSRVSVWTRPAPGSTAWTNLTTFGSDGDGPDQFQQVAGLAVTPDGLQLLVADVSRVSVWTRPDAASTAWTHQASFGSTGPFLGQFILAMGVALSEDLLTAWVSDAVADRVSIWTRPTAGSMAWAAQQAFGTAGAGADGFDQPYGLAVSPSVSVVFVADSKNNRISAWAGVCQ